MIRCGGGNIVAAAREQWNDGSNTLTIAPGVVVVYDRNTVTNKILEEYGLRLIKIRGSELFGAVVDLVVCLCHLNVKKCNRCSVFVNRKCKK